MVNLYIENQFIELDKDVQFAITKTFEDITNPTSIINDWSKTVSIPFTEKNNKIFGHIYNPDRLTLHTSDESLTTGLYFDPLKKLDFRLEWDSMLLMQGYAKMTSVTKSNGKGRYNVTLNGELGKIFQEMKKITFDENAYTGEDKDKYWIDGSGYIKEEINRNLIYNSWNYSSQMIDLEESQTLDIIGFTPNNSYSKNFSYDSFQDSSAKNHKFTDVLGDNFYNETGVNADDVIKDGLLPRNIGEFRSYNQLPFIFFNKLFQIFNKKVESLTDYKIVTDSEWFSSYNPYWTNLVVMGKRFDVEQDYSKAINIYQLQSPLQLGGWTSNYSNISQEWLKPIKIIEEGLPSVVQPSDEDEYPDTFILPNDPNYSNKMIMKLSFLDDGLRLVGATDKTIVDNNALRVRLVLRDRQYFNVIKYGRSVLIMNETTQYFENEDADFIRISALPKGDGEYGISDPLNFDLYLELPNSKFNSEKYVVYLEAGWVNDTQPFGQTTEIYINPIYLNTGGVEMLDVKFTQGGYRTDSIFTLNDLWDINFNLFDFILNYCKVFRIGVFLNELSKEIIYTPLTTYFSNYTIEDWTNKLDLSKDFTINPISFENKYILFNYDENKTELNEKYSKDFGVNYGEYKLTTDYNFNSETKKLFDNIKNSISSTDTILSWNNLINNNIIYNVGNEVFINSKDKEEKEVDVFGQWFLDNGNAIFDTSNGIRPVIISDDTLMQTSNNTFLYSQYDSNKTTTKYRIIDIYDYNTGYSCLFAKPTMNYTYKSEFNNQVGIYYSFWQKYLDERYNTNNKIVTCYLDITPIDYCSFEFNKFIKIDNQLYFVNKIYDYDITSNSTTKVDLITIQDIEGYTTDNFDLKYFEVYNNNDSIWNEEDDYISLDHALDKQTLYITSSSELTWQDKNYTLQSLSINGLNGNGTIPAGVKVPVVFEQTDETDEEGYITISNGIKTIEIFVRLTTP